jgi:excisionase family DNA binding protein
MGAMSKRKPLTVTARDAANVLGLTRQRIYQLVAAGDLAAIRQGRCVLIMLASLRALIKTRAKPRPA